jgi:adenylylsulfate kinase
LLDGDKLREILLDENVPKSYELNSRVSLGLKYAKLCKLISDQNINVIISTISLYKDVFKYLDENILNHYKIYLNFSSEVLKSRNQKSLYSNFEVGQVSNVVGLDIVYDIPEADLTITDEMDGKIEIIVQLIIQKCELII